MFPKKDIQNNLLGCFEVALMMQSGFDRFNDAFFAAGSRMIGRVFWQVGDVKGIDGILVNGTANSVGRLAQLLRNTQTGYLYHYAFTMIVGLLLLIGGIMIYA